MHLTGVLLLAACLHVTARSVSQTVTISDKNLSVQQVFNKIKKQTHYAIFFNKDLLKGTHPVSVNVREMPLREFLNIVSRDQPFDFYIENQNIIIIPKAPATGPPGQKPHRYVLVTIKGKITDGDGKPLAGASVKVKGSDIGAFTDADGNFSLTAPEIAAISISYIGYISQEIMVNGRTEINIVMLTNDATLNQVVVVGYGTQKRKDITGSVAVVDVSALKSIPSGSAEQALQGQASGVNVISSGLPGGPSNVFIRGISSFGNVDPLIIVDGIQAKLSDIRADEIESMQVLKDAGAASIYGVRGSNGVIIITTKKGKAGTTQLKYDAYVGVQLPLPGNPFHILNSEDYARLTKIATPNTALFANGLPDYLYKSPSGVGTAMEGDPAVNPSNYRLDPSDPSGNYLIQKVNKKGTNWYQELFNPALIQSHALTASGGTDRLNYLFSLGYFDQQGTMINTFLKRYSVRVNTEYKFRKNIRVGENAYVFYRQNPAFDNQSVENAISFAYRMMPIIPVYDIAGNFGGTLAGPGLGNARNPVAIRKRTVNNRNNAWDVVGNVFAEVDLLKHLTVRTSFGGTIDNQYNIDFAYNNYNDAEGNTNLEALTETSAYSSNWMWTNTLNYSNTFGAHEVKVTIGTEAIKNSGRTLSGSSQQFFSTDFDYLTLGNGTTNVANSSGAYITSLYSQFARLEYAYDDKYLIGATVRRDGSSRFSPENRYGVFPSVSAGWRVSNEKFMKEISWLTDLKIRGSYGVLGSEINVDPANAYSLYGGGFTDAYYDINGTGNSIQQGFYQTRLGNLKTSWEQDKISNIGLDATLFNNLSFSIDFYKKSIDGLLFPQPLPYTAGGAAAPVINIGDIQNKGIDFSLNYRIAVKKDWRFGIGANITTYKNTVVRIPDPGYFDVPTSLSFGSLVRNQQGHPVSSFFMYDVVGLFKDDADVASSPLQSEAAPGRFKYRDVDGDKEITEADRTFLGSPNPNFTYGLNLSAGYKNFDLSAIFYGSQGNKIINTVRNLTDFFGTFVGGKSDVLLNAWTPEHTNTSIPIVEGTNSFSTSGVPNSYYMENGSYFRLRSLILGYTLPAPILKKFRLGAFRVYLQGANLFTITKYTGLDPELPGSSASFGLDFGNYPNNQRNFILGLNVSF